MKFESFDALPGGNISMRFLFEGWAVEVSASDHDAVVGSGPVGATEGDTRNPNEVPASCQMKCCPAVSP